MTQQQPSTTLTLALAGDVGIRRPDPKSIFSEVAEVLRAADLTLVNQEWPLNDRGQPWPGKAGKLIGSTPDAVEALVFAGVDAVGLANNHTMNYGAEGMFQTLEVLDAASIAHAGAGKDLEAAHAPAILTRAGTHVALLSYTSVFTPGFEATPDRPGLATVRVETTYRVPPRLHEVPGSPLIATTTPDPRDVARLEQDIRRARELAEVVIVSWHWGVSLGYQHLVPYQVELGRRAIELGADLVVGHHPHTLQPVEVYQGKPICYSLAQFGFDLAEGSLSEETMLVECELRAGRLAALYLRPAVCLPDGGVRFVRGEEAVPVVEWIKRLCRSRGTVLTPVGDRLRVELERATARA